MESKKDKREEKKIKKGADKTKKATEKKENQTQKEKPKAEKKAEKTKKEKTSTEKKAGKTQKEKPKAETKADKIKKDELKFEKKESQTEKAEPKFEQKEHKIENEEPEVEITNGIKMKRKTGSRCLSFLWNIFVKIVTIAIIFVSIIIVVQKVTNNEESFLGFRIFRVQTGSMIPKYQIGDVILVREVDTDKIKIGDDVTYEGKTGSMNGLLVTHRVIDIEEVDGKRIFHTQGIANNLEDPVVGEDQINGVVQTKMYILSLICMLLNNKYVFYFCGILPLTIYVAFSIFKSKKVKRIEKEN